MQVRPVVTFEDDFNSRYQKFISNNFFSLIHFNARSLSKNFENISNYLSLLNHEFSVIGVSETWLSNSVFNLISMPNYKFISCCHEQRQGGGIGIYVNEKLDFKERSDIGINDDDICQSRFIELNVTDKIIIIGILYRPPNGNLHKFMEYLNKEVDLLDKTNKSIYLMGDFNINLLKIDTNQLTADFYQTLISYSLIPTITKPTRITHHTATLIDNIFTNDYNHNHSPGLLFTDITDHLPIFLITELSTQKIKNNKTTFRFINKTNLNEFNQAVLSCNWSPVLDESDPNISYNLFMDKFNQLYELYFPFKEHKTKSYKPRKPWIPTGLVKSIKTKHKLFLVYINHNSTESTN